MTKRNAPHHTERVNPRWARTAARRPRLRQHLAEAARTVRKLRPACPQSAYSRARHLAPEADISVLVRQRFLRDYHAANLAKARRGAEDLVRDGWNTGGVPYGYRAIRQRITPYGRRPRTRVRLEIAPRESQVVRLIFAWRVHGQLSAPDIAARLATDPDLYPAPADPTTGLPTPWTPSTIRAVLCNPKYLGRQVWGRHHRGRRAPCSAWVWSDTWAHPALIDADTFATAQQPRRAAPAEPSQAGRKAS